MKSMSLIGGINEYDLSEPERFGDNKGPYGRKVRFLDTNGWPHDIIPAREIFEKGQILTVKEIYVQEHRAYVEFVEVEGRFNTVMFEDIN